MEFIDNINIKALVFGAAISAAFIIFGSLFWDWFYPFSAIGLLYVGYAQNNIRDSTLLGAFASTPIIVLAFQGYLGSFSGFFTTDSGMLSLIIIILIVGAFVGFVGAWAKRNRLKAIEEYEKKNRKGKKKKKK